MFLRVRLAIIVYCQILALFFFQVLRVCVLKSNMSTFSIVQLYILFTLCTLTATAVKGLFKALIVINERRASGERLGGKPQHLFQTLIIFMFTYSILLGCKRL